MMLIKSIPSLITLWAIIASAEMADTLSSRMPVDATDSLSSLVKSGLIKRHPEGKVDLTGPIRWMRGSLPAHIESVKILGENARGEAQFQVFDSELGSVSEGWINYAVWFPARIALRRVRPGEVLHPDMFATQEINLSYGLGHEYRGVILPIKTEISGLEARQTILEGQFLVSTAIQKIPDIRRGDAVHIHLISRDLVLTTLGVAEESAYLNGSLKVLASKTKRELTGKLQSGGVVEVRL